MNKFLLLISVLLYASILFSVQIKLTSNNNLISAFISGNVNRLRLTNIPPEDDEQEVGSALYNCESTVSEIGSCDSNPSACYSNSGRTTIRIMDGYKHTSTPKTCAANTTFVTTVVADSRLVFNYTSTNNALRKVLLSQTVRQQNQNCGNCWAIASTGLFESFLCRLYNGCSALSTVFVSSCSISKKVISSNGCDGGDPYLATLYLKKGLTFQSIRSFYSDNTYSSLASYDTSTTQEVLTGVPLACKATAFNRTEISMPYKFNPIIWSWPSTIQDSTPEII